jgi:hypothetical protein
MAGINGNGFDEIDMGGGASDMMLDDMGGGATGDIDSKLALEH